VTCIKLSHSFLGISESDSTSSIQPHGVSCYKDKYTKVPSVKVLAVYNKYVNCVNKFDQLGCKSNSEDKEMWQHCIFY
jgi:hypothetical protein